jgi:CopG antitoxin of type II toxin-antitoxin system
VPLDHAWARLGRHAQHQSIRAAGRAQLGSSWCKLMHMDDIRTTVKMPDDIHERVSQLAERERRNFSGQVVWLIERALEAIDRGQDKDPR